MGFLFVSAFPMQAQKARAKGDRAWAEGKVKEAINNYENIKNIEKDKLMLAKRGLAYFKLNYLKKAVKDFTQSKKLGNNDPELFNLMAQSKQHMGEYEEAAFFYKEYIKAVGEKDSRANRAFVELKNCTFSATNKNLKSIAYSQNFGESVNGHYDEIYPIQSPRYGNIHYFTSNQNRSDMEVRSFTMETNGDFLEDKKFGEGVNSEFDDYVMDVSPNGKSMLYIRNKDDETKAKIFVSTFDDNEKQHVIELPDYKIYGAIDLQIQDSNTIAFASNELGGAGGYDIFTINYKNGIWSDPINVGEAVNTEFDERSPFIASNGDFIYFSSNRPYCYGGFDVYYYNNHGLKEKPSNLGKPINSAGNDLQFRLNADGQMAVMSSDRKTGFGAYDIYMMYMKDPKPIPSRDSSRLEYVKDYLDKLALREKGLVSHFDKLKDKLDIEPVEDKVEQEVELTAEDIEASPIADLIARKEKEAKNKKGKKQSKSSKQDELLKDKNTTKTSGVAEVNKGNDEETDLKLNAESDQGSDKGSDRGVDKVAEIAGEDSETNKLEEDKSQLATIEDNTRKEVDAEKVKQVKDERTKAAKINELVDMEDDSKAGLMEVAGLDVRQLRYTILYQDRHDLQNEVNKEKLERFAKLLILNPDYGLHLIAFTDYKEPGLPEFMQYNTLKRANLIAKILMEFQVPKDQISIESVSNNYPLAKREISGNASDHLPLNKRVDIEIRDGSGSVLLNQEIEDYKLPSYALDRKYELYSQIREELYYSVEIGNSPHIFKNAVLRLYDDIYIRKEDPTANNKYFIGIYTQYSDAMELQVELAESSAPYAKIVAFYNGMPIKEDQIEFLTKDYPHLKEYLAGVEND